VVVIKTLLPELRKVVGELAEDLLARSTRDATINAGLKEAFDQVEKAGRTAQAFEVWREDYLDQVAVAWVLACVFVRFMEDNGLIDECWLAGEGARRKLAEDTQELFFREHPHDTDREYFQHVFHEVGKIPAARDLFAEGKSPLWAMAPSGDAAMKLLKFWREMEAATGHLKRSFQVESGDTRFLGDLYQELSIKAQKKFALLQTPVFVEEFILDRTLTPALAEFGLEKVRMIDPTCGSGHFLLGGFARLFDLWSKPDHTTGTAENDAQKALDGVWGVDINPFAVAIARFRLIVAAVQACGIERLKKAPGWNIHLASGDSLLFGSKPGIGGERVAITQQLNLFEVSAIYAVEDRKTLQEILGQGYHVVVGNPPYITVKDKAQNEAYRQLYSSCHRKYSLAIPFAQRFWELAVQQSEESAGCGYVGQITANSFMKREFGKKLIEEFFPKVDLTHVIDTSGAYIPGHGTPTVILFGRSRKPISDIVRAVQGIKGEPSTPGNPSQGLVWQSIVRQIDVANSQDTFNSTADVARTTFASHPWSIGGGGASDLMESLEERAQCSLNDSIDLVGVFGMTNADEVFLADRQSFVRSKIEPHCIRQLQLGDELRDWTGEVVNFSIFPYSDKPALIPIEDIPGVYKWLWPSKTVLGNRATFEKGTYFSEGLPWWKWHQVALDRLNPPLTIVFSFVATHNHFVLDRGGNVFNRSAPIIKLPAEATEDDHFALLGLLNSSTACFWMKQVFHNKGDSTDLHGARTTGEAEFNTYEFTGTGLQKFPVAFQSPIEMARALDELASLYIHSLPDVVCNHSVPTRDLLDESRKKSCDCRGEMIALQEELDWKCYKLYDLLQEDLCYQGNVIPRISPGFRAFEFVMARQIANGTSETTWFKRHGFQPISEIPQEWPSAYRELVERRIEMIETNNYIGLIENGIYKRRWNSEPWNEQEQRALKNWLLDRLETPKYRKGTKDNPELTTTAQMADVASADAEFRQVAELYRGRPDFDMAGLVAELVEGEAVPFLPILRYKPTGLRKREVWERTWDLQRLEDAGKSEGEIPVPPKYANADFLKTDFWRLRGKLDVPKERWISYPHCSTESDTTLVVGWAGWNHLEQATALISYYDARKREGWDAKRLTPLLAGLDQLLPWIHQWHTEIDHEFGETAGQSFQTMLEHDAHELGLTLNDVRNWTPPEKAKKSPKGRKKKIEAEDDE
jgi:hypothetical protein